MPFTSLSLGLYAAYVAAAAVCFSRVLVDDGMILSPIQAWLRNKYRWCDASGIEPVFVEIDDQWWWKPLWGCPKCVAGQWAFWGYLAGCLQLEPLRFADYSLIQHLLFTSLAILFGALWRAAYSWSQTIQ